MLLWIHPIVQSLTALLALYVLWLGLARFASRHLGTRTSFKWNRHVMLGKVVVVVWILGAVGGVMMTYLTYGKIFTESLHFRIGMLMLPVLLITWLTGTYMDRHKGESTVIPVVHLVNNLLLLILAGMQAYSGVGIVQNALLK